MQTKASGHYDREITTTSRQGKPLRGRMSVHDGAVRVTTPDGRWNATQVGGSPPQGARCCLTRTRPISSLVVEGLCKAGIET
jgi:hypothetical protein